MVLLHVGDGRVLQVFLGAERGLGAVRMMGEQGLAQAFPDLVAVVRERHVLLFVDGLELGMEAADHVVAEAVRLDSRPVVYLVGRDVLGIDGLVIGGPGVRSVGAYDRHQLVVFVRNRKFGGFVAHGIYPVVDGLALRFVLRFAVGLEELFDLVQHGLFGLIVARSELLRSLEHQVLEVVGEAGGLRRVVLAADLDSDIGLDARLILIDGHVELEPVVQGVDLCSERIALHAFIAGSAGKEHEQQMGCRCDSDWIFHYEKRMILLFRTKISFLEGKSTLFFKKNR